MDEDKEPDPIHGNDSEAESMGVTTEGEGEGKESKKKKKKKKPKKKKKEKKPKISAEEQARRAQIEEDRDLYGDDTMFLNEKNTWFQDFYSLFWNRWYKGDNRNLYLVIQVLQLKEGVIPSNAHITKQLLEREYDLIGYGTEQLSFGDGKVKYGEFEVPLYRGPIYACEFEQIKMTPLKIRISVDKPNLNLPPLKPEPRTELDKKLKPALNLLKKKEKGKKTRSRKAMI